MIPGIYAACLAWNTGFWERRTVWKKSIVKCAAGKSWTVFTAL